MSQITQEIAPVIFFFNLRVHWEEYCHMPTPQAIFLHLTPDSVLRHKWYIIINISSTRAQETLRKKKWKENMSWEMRCVLTCCLQELAWLSHSAD